MGRIRNRLSAAPLSAKARALALTIFGKLAAVEAERHGVPIDEVSFHGGRRRRLNPRRGRLRRRAGLARPAAGDGAHGVGHGHVHTAHGVLPIPAPRRSRCSPASHRGWWRGDGADDSDRGGNDQRQSPRRTLACRREALRDGVGRWHRGSTGATQLASPGHHQSTGDPATRDDATLWQLETNLDDIAIAFIILHTVAAFMYDFKFDFDNISGLLSLLVLLPVPITGLFRYQRMDRKWHLRSGLAFAIYFITFLFYNPLVLVINRIKVKEIVYFYL